MPAQSSFRGLAAILLASVFATACNGGNPFKRQSNPVSEYQGVIDNSETYDPNKKPAIIVDADNSQFFCGNAFDVTVINDQSAKLMTFVEDNSSSYTVNVRSYLGDDFVITSETSDRPDGSEFKQIAGAKNEANVKSFQFTWKPTKADSQKDKTPVLTLRYTSSLAKQKCPTSVIRGGISLSIETSELAPLIGFAGIPQVKSLWGDKFDFVVEVSDSSSTAASPPSLGFATFKSSVNSGERPANERILDATDAVNCDRPGAKLKEGTASVWEFHCTFDTKKVKDAKANEGKGLSRQASFWFKATSARSKAESELTGQSIEIEFPAPVIQTPAATGAEPITLEGVK